MKKPEVNVWLQRKGGKKHHNRNDWLLAVNTAREGDTDRDLASKTRERLVVGSGTNSAEYGAAECGACSVADVHYSMVRYLPCAHCAYLFGSTSRGLRPQ